MARMRAAMAGPCCLLAWSLLFCFVESWLRLRQAFVAGPRLQRPATLLRGRRAIRLARGGLELQEGLRPNRTLPASSVRNEALPDGGEDESDADEGQTIARMQLPMKDKFGLAYTCGKCNTRNVISVGRVAWQSGVVVATCKGCGVRHLLADSGGLLDLGNDTNFRNIVSLMESRGEEVLRIDSTDPEAMEALNLTVGEDGKLRYVGNQPEEPTAKPEAEATSAVDSSVFASIDEVETALEQAVVEEEEAAEALENVEDVDSGPLIIQLRDDVSRGDVLAVNSPEHGMLHVPVPPEAVAGCRIVVEGMVEVGISDEHPRWVRSAGDTEWEQRSTWIGGDRVAIAMPEGAVAQIQIPPDTPRDAMLQIAYPVAVLPEKR
eukprot:TRINITY_DN80168_c0_g1_i1.p1 TRINITY_DN80168_c0_g1~~TRINITY_DN80168_c0_g1_i1.p1  ORF type:complete len:378 (-),score=74.60 TRINITY_DN80168_c0_g1_i1:178-1311(-)